MQYQFAFNSNNESSRHIEDALNSVFHPNPPDYNHHHDLNNAHTTVATVTMSASTFPMPPLFNVHEIWAISIATIYFIVGFPSNLISIIVCLRSLFGKPSLTRQRRGQLYFTANPNYNHHYRNSPPHIRGGGGGVYRHMPNRNMNYDEAQVNMSLFSPDNNIPNQQQQQQQQQQAYVMNAMRRGSLPCILNQQRRSTCRRLLINLNRRKRRKEASMPNNNCAAFGGSQHHQQTAAGLKLTRNPHRHCFELYLIEICFCDLFILAYFFVECALLFFSRLKLIDSIYVEPMLISKFMCQFIIGFNRTVILLHNWLVSSLALTRCYAIYKPLNSTANFGQNFYLRLNLFVLFSLVLGFSFLNILGIMPLEYKRFNQNETSVIASEMLKAIGLNSSSELSIPIPHAQCTISQAWYAQFKYIEVYINITLGVIGYSLPCFITLIVNLILIYNIRNINMFRSATTTSSFNGNGSTGTTNKSTLPLTSTTQVPYQNGSLHMSSSGNGGGGGGGVGVGGGGSLINHNGGNGSHSRQFYKSRNQFVKTTSSLLTLSFSYLICYIPYTFCFLLLSLELLHMNNDLIFALTCLRYLNHTLNFFIYFATGKRFRNEVIAFLGFKK